MVFAGVTLKWRRFTSRYTLTLNGINHQISMILVQSMTLPRTVLSFFNNSTCKIIPIPSCWYRFTLTESRFKISVKVLVPYFEVMALILYKIATFYFQRTTNVPVMSTGQGLLSLFDTFFIFIYLLTIFWHTRYWRTGLINLGAHFTNYQSCGLWDLVISGALVQPLTCLDSQTGLSRRNCGCAAGEWKAQAEFQAYIANTVEFRTGAQVQ